VTGNNTYSGTTTISAGTLQVGNGGTSGALGAGAVVNNGVLAINRSDDITQSAIISGSGALSKSGAGKLTVTGNNTYAGTTTIAGGTLQVGNGGTSGSLGAGGIVNNGALVLNRSDSFSLAGAHSGTGSLLKQGAGKVTMALNSAVQGNMDVTAGTLVLGASGNITSPLIRVSGGAALDASLRSAGLSLGSGQTLMNVGGTAGIAGTLDTTSGQLALSFAPGTPAMSISNGVLILAATTQLRITNNGAALGKGTYRIISKLSGGLVSGTVPAVSIEGGGIISGGLARLSIVSGELVLTVKAVTQLISGVKPPEILFHQGFLVDATGTALGSPNPKNYELAFRMYTAANGGTPVWGERQTVTVDNGRFGVHLGEGDPYQGDPTQDLSSVFIASEGTLYIETTVRGGGVSGADLVLTPRALVPPTAYAFLSRHARGAGTLVNNSNQTVLSVVGTRVGINNSMPQSALDVAGSVRSTNIVGTGTAVVAGTITAKKFEGRGIVPIGGIIVWSGTKPPTGWALCDGQVANGRKTPDLRGRFVVGTGAGTGLTSREAGQVGGLEKVTLTAQQMPVHRHVVDVPALPTQSGGGHNHVFQSGAGSGEGLGKDDNQNHWLYSGAYITGHWTDGAGNHTHVVDIPNFRVVPVGGGQPANNLPPFYAMAYIMRVE
jgi:autotransporter-associated beta strand protein